MSLNAHDFKLPGEFEYRGVLYCGLNEKVDVDMMKAWTTDPSDALIAAYPKTGNI